MLSAMSRGPGRIERRIAELFAATQDRALGIGEIAAYAFELEGPSPSRAQRLSATRAAHRVLRRVETLRERIRKASAEAKSQAHAMGHEQPGDRAGIAAWWEYGASQDATPAGLIASRLKDELKSSICPTSTAWSRRAALGETAKLLTLTLSGPD